MKVTFVLHMTSHTLGINGLNLALTGALNGSLLYYYLYIDDNSLLVTHSHYVGFKVLMLLHRTLPFSEHVFLGTVVLHDLMSLDHALAYLELVGKKI